MRLKFKNQVYQNEAVKAVIDCFAGQPLSDGVRYHLNPESIAKGRQQPLLEDIAFKNNRLLIDEWQLLKNIHAVQRQQNLPLSTALATNKICPVNLDIEMETGTGKTYCYIKTMFELYQHYGWNKFIVVVPSIAIREGVYKTLEITADHFLETYGKRARFFIYNSKQLHYLESFSSDASINVMVINAQAFNATGKDNRRIYEKLDDFQSRRPIDVISDNHPILILDEPQKMEGQKTLDSLKEFNPLMILRYSATHKTSHNKIYRLDALDAYNQKLVKKIAVRGITVKGNSGAHAYLYLESIDISSSKPPTALIELDVKQEKEIKRLRRRLSSQANLFQLSKGLDQYKGFIIADIDARENTVIFTNGLVLHVGEAIGDVNEATLRRIQIREAIKAHLEKEQVLFYQRIKVLSLFFIDQVAKYRCYGNQGEMLGEYAKIFEEEYALQLKEILDAGSTPYSDYLSRISVANTHSGYFSIDKKSKRMIDPQVGKKSTEADDADAYDLILKDKERLLSLAEPVRFIFSHSALREGWDNPNVFVICALKHSDNTVTRRQEVGRGLRLSVNQAGDRMDDPATVHEINVLTVVASESYEAFVGALQQDISLSLTGRPRVADQKYFTGKLLKTETGDIEVTAQMAHFIYRYLLKNDYIDTNDTIAENYHTAKNDGHLAALPPELQAYAQQIFELIDSVFSEAQIPEIDNATRTRKNPLNENFYKKEFKELWDRINRKAIYSVDFETKELIEKCVKALDSELSVTTLQYIIQHGAQTETTTYENLLHNKAFEIREQILTRPIKSTFTLIKYDLIGKLALATQLTRKTVAHILQDISPTIFDQYQTNPEDFILKAGQLINEQKATVIVEHLSYDAIAESYSLNIFTREKAGDDFSKAVRVKHHIYDYVLTDSKEERLFAENLDTSVEVVVYAKLPRGFFIPTPVGNYNPDWAIAFREGVVKHIYFVAETKGALSSLQLRKIEQCKIDCARKFFRKITSDQVKYGVVDSYEKLRQLVEA
jgi:type III restriction enzyme